MVAIFYSGDEVHMNEHINALRESVVLYTEKGAKQWMKDRNGWGKIKYIK